jgi:hypothetical protein
MSKRHQVVFKIVDGGTLVSACCDILQHLMEHAGRICTAQSIAKALGLVPGRSLSVHVAMIRRALPEASKAALLTCHGCGYMWIGDPVVIEMSGASEVGPAQTLALMDSKQVARRLQITVDEVNRIEHEALAKLRANPEARDLFEQMIRCAGECQYNPFYQVWLYTTRKSRTECGRGDDCGRQFTKVREIT